MFGTHRTTASPQARARLAALAVGAVAVLAPLVLWIAWDDEFPVVPLAGRADTWREGYIHARQLMEQVDSEGCCWAVDAKLQHGPDGLRPKILDYLFEVRETYWYTIRVDNSVRTVRVWVIGEGLAVDEIRKKRPDAFKPIDWSVIQVDIADLVRIAEEQYGSEEWFTSASVLASVNLARRDGLQVADIHWESPLHHFSLTVNAETGELVDAWPTTQQATSSPGAM